MIKQIRADQLMENRSLSVVAGLIVLLAMPFAALAADSAADADQQARLDKAAAMRSESKARQAEADQLLAEKNTACAKKFLVNDCRNAAYQEYLKTTREARRLENDGKALEREVKKEQLSERDQRRAAEAPRREADLQARQAEAAAARQMAADKAATSRASKAKKAVNGERRKAAEAEKFRQKQQAHDARVAQKKREAERRAAQAGARK